MTDDLGFIWTPQFLVGTIIAGLLLNIVSTYVVRAFDHLRKVLPVSYRRAREAEVARIEQLASLATTDTAFYAALAAEASRLRLHQLLCFFIAFVCIATVLLLFTLGLQRPGMSALGILVIVVLFAMSLIQYSMGLDKGKHARRLDAALSQVHRNRGLPIT